MNTINLRAPDQPVGKRIVLFDEVKQDAVFTPQSLREYLRATKTRLDEMVNARLRSDEILLIKKSFVIEPATETEQKDFGDFFYTVGGGFFPTSESREVGLWMLRDEYNGYCAGFARVLRTFRSMCPDYPILNIIVQIYGYRDTTTKIVQAPNPDAGKP
ncbi:MAG: hypothetical protein AABX86_02545 [Nanoarchaeota archaeon]